MEFHENTPVSKEKKTSKTTNIEAARKEVKYFKECIEAKEKLYGPYHNSTLEAYRKLGLVYLHYGYKKQALEYLDQAYKLLHKKLENTEKDNQILKNDYADLNQEVENLYFIDSMTGLYSREYLHNILLKISDEQKHTQIPFSIMIIEIDHLDLINSRIGYKSGDEVIKQTALLIAKEIKNGNILCKYNSNSFIVLLPNKKADTTEELANRIKSLIFNNTFKYLQREIQSTISIGISEHYPPRIINFYNLINQAKQALLIAKKAGGNKIQKTISEDNCMSYISNLQSM